MKLSELLTVERIALSVHAGDLRSAVRTLADGLARSGALDPRAAEEVVRRVRAGDAADVVRIDEAFLLVGVETGGVTSLVAALGVSPTPFRVDTGGGDATMARGLILLLTPQRLASLRVQAIPTLVRYFREDERSRKVLEAETPDDVRGLSRFDEVGIHDRLLVEDALTPLQYRVYPDTPMEEVVDLMIRRGLHAMPVVGENHEVLGILTSGDALEHLLPRRLASERKDQGPSRAREVMSRSVLCVSEDQQLVEAANTMINKDVAQLPVVREGELIGFLTRETVLRLLFGR